jgi:hypothetical protein
MKISKRKNIEQAFAPVGEQPPEGKSAPGGSIEASILPCTVHPSAKVAYTALRPQIRRSLTRGD